MLGNQNKQVPDPFKGRNRLRNLTVFAAVVSLCSLTLVACGNSTPASTTGAASNPSKLTPITMVVASDGPSFSPVFLAQAAGIFKKHGLSVTTAALSSGSTAAAALVSGSAQFDAGVASDVLLANNKGIGLLGIASVSNSVTLDLEVNKAWASAHNITTSTPLSQRLLALKGAKIGITAKASITDLALQYMLSSAGLKSVNDYEELSLGSDESRLAALQHDEIQAAMFDPAEAAIATQQGAGLLLAKGTAFPLLAKSAFDQIVTTASYAKSHPAIVREVAASLAEANNLINNNPGQALSYLQPQFNSYPKSVLATALPQYGFTEDARMSAVSWTSMAQVLVAGGELPAQEAAKAKTDFTNSYLP